MIYALLSLIHICRDLRAFGGTSLDPNFLVGGPKSIYTTRAGAPYRGSKGPNIWEYGFIKMGHYHMIQE